MSFEVRTSKVSISQRARSYSFQGSFSVLCDRFFGSVSLNWTESIQILQIEETAVRIQTVPSSFRSSLTSFNLCCRFLPPSAPLSSHISLLFISVHSSIGSSPFIVFSLRSDSSFVSGTMVDCSQKLSAVIENYVPSLEELKQVFQKSLSGNFENVEVDITTCPDLSKHPFNQTSSGFGVNLKIAEVGGPGNLFPGFHTDHQFDISTIGQVCEHPQAAVFGPGAGPWPIVGQNCEMVADVNLKTGRTATRIAEIKPGNGQKEYSQRSVDQPKFSLMANLALSDADKSARVVHFKVSVRKGDKNLTMCIRDGLQEHFGERVVSLAGQFILQSGKAKLHVMPDFPGCPFADNAAVDTWLRYFEMDAPLVCTTVMHSCDPGHNLRLEHTHCYSNHGDAGHYHYDVTPATVTYEGWFAPANKVYRIDEVSNR